MTNNHDHSHGEQAPGLRQPSQDAIIRNQTLELNRINDNRIFLLSLIDELQVEIARLQVENASLKERLEQSDVKLVSSNGDAPSV